MKAHVLLRDKPWYRREVFVEGLRKCGHAVITQHPAKMDRDTLLVIWNRYADNHALALQVERAGGRVLVAENGYIGRAGVAPKFDVHPKGPQPDSYYALAESYHNGGGIWPGAFDSSRWSALGLSLKPWRTEGRHLLVCPNRSFGIPGRTMPTDWAEKTAGALRKATGRPVVIRPHPGNDAPRRALEHDLKDAWAVYVWSSSCGVHALLEGIPVICAAPYWIMKGASAHGDVEKLDLPDRLPAFERMAWAQWTCEEIANGEPFRHLLPATG